jgi:GAF domain-containing protein
LWRLGLIIRCVATWPQALISVAAVRVALGLALYLAGQVHRTDLPLPIGAYAALAATFGVTGLTLVAANRRDVRAMWLGGVFILASVPLVTPLLSDRPLADFGWLTSIRLDSFLPALLWRFAGEFPCPLPERQARAVRVVWQTASVAGLALLLVNLTYLAWPRAPGADDPRLLFTPVARAGSLYYPLVFGGSAAAFPMLLWRASRATGDERRRALLFTGAFVAGSLPLVLQVSFEAVPSYFSLVNSVGLAPLVSIVGFGALATIPFVTAYSVLFDHVVELRVVLRAAVRYGLARYTIVAVTMVPFAGLALFVVSHREEPTVALASGSRALALLAMALAGLAALRYRRAWLGALDRKFFREECDAREMLSRLAADALVAHDARALETRVHDAVAAALHAEACLFIQEKAGQELVHALGQRGPIGDGGILVTLVAADPEPMDVDPSDDRSPFRRLPNVEQRWLLDGGFRLLVALRSAGGRPTGILALTAKRSGLDYSAEDRRLVSAVGAAVSLALDNLRLRAAPDPAVTPAALECPRCLRLEGPTASACRCGGSLVAASAPFVLRGTYQLERRLGAGGMGIVYLARDLNLGRFVAVKTLPKPTANGAARLCAEARAMAAVTHPNLAVVYGIETWNGIPFLVEEFLAGGTLADRLARCPLPVVEALDLGVSLADALVQLHQAGFVHRDIKPGNIAFTSAGTVKLLDFGLARLVADVTGDASTATTRTADNPPTTTSGLARAVVGTLPYMSPEALSGRMPHPSFDLWSLAVVLYESITGKLPFDGGGALEIALATTRPLVAPSRLLGACPPEVDRFFVEAFMPEGERQRSDAATVADTLRDLRSYC